jgi:hypothetical protein
MNRYLFYALVWCAVSVPIGLAFGAVMRHNRPESQPNNPKET